MKKILSTILLITLLLVGCKKGPDGPSTNTNNGPVYITFAPSVSIADGGNKASRQTKTETVEDPIVGTTGVDGITSTENKAPILTKFKAQVIGTQGQGQINNFSGEVYIDNSGISLDQAVEFTPSTSTDSDEQKVASGGLGNRVFFPTLSKDADDTQKKLSVINLKAYSPTDTPELVVRTENFVKFSKLTGTTDVLVSQMQNSKAGSSDPYIPGTAQAHALSDNKIDLLFWHALSKISFVLQPIASGAELAAANTSWGNILSIELLDHPSSVELNLNTNDVTTLSDTPSNILVFRHKNAVMSNDSIWSLEPGAIGGALTITNTKQLLYSTTYAHHFSGTDGTAMIPISKKIKIKINSQKHPKGIFVEYERNDATNALTIGTHHIFPLLLSKNKGVELGTVSIRKWEELDDFTMEF